MGYYNQQTFNEALQNPSDVTELNIIAENLDKCLSFNNLEILNISYGYDFVLPEELINLKKLHTINLGSFPVKFPTFLTEMKQLKHLQFPHFYRYSNYVKDYELFFDDFDKMENLESLTIYFIFCDFPNEKTEPTYNEYTHSYDQIEQKKLLPVPNSIFKMKNLKKLDLSINKVEELPENAFLGLENIEELSLSYGSMTTQTQENIFSLKNLKKLNFNGNFVYLKAEMAQRTRFENFSEKIINLKNLQSLSIINSKITEIPAFFKQLTQLEELDFRSNDIKDLPFLLSEMPNLAKLVLNGNKKLLIDKIFNNKNNLRELELIACNLKNVPESILNCEKLEKLNLFANKLEFLPEKILQLPNLLELEIDKNPFCNTTELKTSTTVNNLLESFRKRKLSTKLQMLELSLIQNRTEILKNAEKEDLLACLYTANAPIRRNALATLENHIKTPFSLELEKEKAVISILGDVAGIKITALTNFFKEKEYKIISKITAQTTHICIGEQPKIDLKSILEVVSEQKISLALPKHLKDFQQLLEKPYLLEVSEEMTQNILDLLLSENVDNQQLALQMMETGGIPSDILYILVLMIMGNWNSFEGKSQKIRLLLAKYAPTGLLAAVQKYYRKGPDTGIKMLFKEDAVNKKQFVVAGLDYFYEEEFKYDYNSRCYRMFFDESMKIGGEYATTIFKKYAKDNTLNISNISIDAKYLFTEAFNALAEIDTIKVKAITGNLKKLNSNVPNLKKIIVNFIANNLLEQLQKLLPNVEIKVIRK